MRCIACLVLILLPAAGCSICAPGYLEDYPVVGGKWQRTDPTRGRVGSILSDVGQPYGADEVLDGQYYNEEYYGDGYSEYYPDQYVPAYEGYVPAVDHTTAPSYTEGIIGQAPESSRSSGAPTQPYAGSSILEESF